MLSSFGILLSSAEFYSSVHKMSIVMDFEVKMLENMQKFIGKNQNKLNYIKERLSEYEREREEAMSQGPVYFENPVNKYLLNKRLTVDWERLENVLQYKEGEKTLKRIENTIVNTTELDGALEGVLRLHDVYRLNASDIASGLLQGVQYDVQFQARHCFDLGIKALDIEFPKLAYAWFMEALRRSSNDENINKLDIELAIASTKLKLGDVKGANATFTELVSLHPHNEKVAKVFEEFVKTSIGQPEYTVDYSTEHFPPPEDIQTAPRHDLFKFTCSGLLKKQPREERELRCGYLVETHPFLWIAPIKVEELNHNPLLVVFYDVLSDKEIETIRQLTKEIERATVMSNKGNIVSSVRTSQFQFIPVTRHPILATVDRRVEDMTNLNMKCSEEHQFANYGIGGQYSEHHDYFDFPEVGNRIATVLFYLSDVEQGGGTAYPQMKQLVMPKKGAAAFWYNLHASGKFDVRTLHGACPIIVGSKWVQNRWIREKDQMDRRPCYKFDDSLYH
ncbi:prolyl 4-hydroxylase subunit alpha-2 [Stomoxys calcitrans]|uniref:prolyl 4-hydroxylase subunit alpha-2 n=1 Tax=Stomoxys calcitrans TaxID=35570 RepID=UPI0027E312A2|nr:prolyl 4-hydroxylase subunit alpha-2 [Stomoxys calcitrans]